MLILVDTNVLLDYIMARGPFKESAERIMKALISGEVDGRVAAHSIANLFYILRKMYTIDERRDILGTLCRLIPVVGIDGNMIDEALSNKKFSDFEDCLQMECAKAAGAKFIVTRNLADFQGSDVEAISPEDFVRRTEIKNIFLRTQK
jgi:predicted nucleic acid-binding protein